MDVHREFAHLTIVDDGLVSRRGLKRGQAGGAAALGRATGEDPVALEATGAGGLVAG
jgi:hypothetical protein